MVKLFVLALTVFISFCYAGDVKQVKYSAVLAVERLPAGETIRYGDHPEQFIRKWSASSSASPRGDVVFIHGGCWLQQYDISHSEGMLSALSREGFNVYGIEYTRSTEEQAGWPQSFSDIRQAVATLKQSHLNNAWPNYLMGHSAGGHLAVLAAPEFAADFTAIIGLAAITDVTAYARGSNSCEQATKWFMGGTPESATTLYDKANPRNYAMPENLVLLHGDDDNIVSLAQSQWEGVKHVVIEGAGHFDYLHPESLAYHTLLKLLNKED